MLPRSITSNHFFPPGSIAISGLEITGCGYMVKTELNTTVKGRVLETFALLYYTQGEGWFESESCKRRQIRPGTAIILFPHEKHWYGPLKNNYLEEYWFLYNGSLPSFFNRPGLTPQNPVLEVGVSPYLASLCKEAVKIGQEQEHISHVPGRMVGLLFQVLYEINSRSPQPVGSRKYDAMILDLINQIKKEPQKPFDFPVVAKDLGISYSLLRKRIAEFTGKPPIQFLNEHRVALASRLLTTGNSIKEVCFQVGMTDPYYFSRLYRQQTGKSPRNFYKSVIAWAAAQGKARRGGKLT